MKNLLKKVISSVAAVTMAVTIMGGVGSSIPVYAAEGDVTVTKDTNYTGTFEKADAAGEQVLSITTPTGAQSTDEFTYTVYKIFDATSNGTSVSYTNTRFSGDNWPIIDDSTATNQTKFDTDGSNVAYYTSTDSGATWTKVDNAAGTEELTPAMITKLGTLTSQFTTVGTVKITGANQTGHVKLDYGYYYVTSTTGSVVAINTNKSGATVGDKNSVPTVDKTITSVDDGTVAKTSKGSVDTTNADTTLKDKRAIAEVGSTVHYQSVITVGEGRENYKFKDKMEDALSLNTNSIKVYKFDKDTAITSDAIAAATAVTASGNYTLNTTADSNRTFEIDFENSYVSRLNTGDKIVVVYDATVNSSALQTDPATNTATISYGHDSSYTSTPSETKTYNAKLTVRKTDGTNPLPGAGFKLKNAQGKYYKETTTDGKTTVSWVDNESDGTQKEVAEVTLNQGQENETKVQQTEFNGLGSGTYTLIETKVPEGYNKAQDATITVKAATGDDANNFGTDLKLENTVINNAGSTLPSTGGIGTTIFYVIGGVLIAGAAILLITRRKKA